MQDRDSPQAHIFADHHRAGAFVDHNPRLAADFDGQVFDLRQHSGNVGGPGGRGGIDVYLAAVGDAGDAAPEFVVDGCGHALLPW